MHDIVYHGEWYGKPKTSVKKQTGGFVSERPQWVTTHRSYTSHCSRVRFTSCVYFNYSSQLIIFKYIITARVRSTKGEAMFSDLSCQSHHLVGGGVPAFPGLGGGYLHLLGGGGTYLPRSKVGGTYLLRWGGGYTTQVMDGGVPRHVGRSPPHQGR